MNKWRRGFALLAALTLLFTGCVTAMAQEKSAPAGRGFSTVILHETAAESTEAPEEPQGMSMWDITMIGLGIAGALLLLMFIMAVTTKKEPEKGGKTKKR